MMKAVRFSQFGGPEVLEIVDLPDPHPGPGQIRADDARWLRACLWPDQPERIERLEVEMALAATAPPLLLHGDAVEAVPDAFARVPADALPVITTTWALSHFPLESRRGLLPRN
jgi:hypothetical protein